MWPLLKSIHSLFRARLLGIMASSALLAGLLIFILAAGLYQITDYLVRIEIPWLDSSINWLAGIAAGVGGWFMLPVLIALIAGIFQEKVIARVEGVYYPENFRMQEPRLWPDLFHDLRFTAKAVVLNLLVLPFYLIGAGPFLSIALNSYLLGREFFESAAGYHLGKPEARRMGKNHKLPVYGGGFLITLVSLVPLINLFIPVFATVWMVHVYNLLRSQAE